MSDCERPFSKLFVIYIILKINDFVIKLFHVKRITAFGIYLTHCHSHCSVLIPLFQFF